MARYLKVCVFTACLLIFGSDSASIIQESSQNSTDNAVIAACVQALHALNKDFASLDVSTQFSDGVDCSKTFNLGSRANLMRLCRRPDL